MQAWNNLTPKDGEQTNGDRYGHYLPDLQDEYCYLPEFLYQIGVAGQGLSGLVPLTFQEIEAWSRMTGAELNRFEAETIRVMSASYCAIANNRESECPIQADEIKTVVEKANVSTWLAVAKS